MHLGPERQGLQGADRTQRRWTVLLGLETDTGILNSWTFLLREFLLVETFFYFPTFLSRACLLRTSTVLRRSIFDH